MQDKYADCGLKAGGGGRHETGRWSHSQMLGDNDGKDDHQIVQRKSAGACCH